MLMTIFNVIYVFIAAAMAVMILLQRGAGAQAGSGFGGGASATVFGARGSANFLSRSTAVLAGLFFLMSLLMGMYIHPVATKSDSDLGVMSGVGSEPAKAPDAAAPAKSDVPSAPAAAGANDKPQPTAAAAEKKDDGGGQKPDADKKN